MIRTEEHNKKIGESVKRHYAQETKEQKEQRINAIKERKRIEKRLYERWIELNKIFEIEI